jgi:peptidase E
MSPCVQLVANYVRTSTSIPSGTRDYQQHYYTRNVYHTHAHFDCVCSALEQLKQFRENLNDAKEKCYTEA